MSTQNETPRERIARQIREENEKAADRQVENERKLKEADDKTVDKYKKLVEKANKKAKAYKDALEKARTHESDYDEVTAEILRYQADIVELGRESELIHVDSIYDPEDEVQEETPVSDH